MAMPAAERRSWTRAEVVALIDANPLHSPRYELVDGELLVTPSPAMPHQRAVRELLVALDGYAKRSGSCEAFDSPFDVGLEAESLVQPDVFVVPFRAANPAPGARPVAELLLAVEVVSPTSGRFDRGRKRLLYQRHVPEYWIVDLDSRVIERWRPGDDRPEILHETITWLAPGATESFVLALDSFFATVVGD
jgi:Uma2 family endonuclease